MTVRSIPELDAILVTSTDGSLELVYLSGKHTTATAPVKSEEPKGATRHGFRAVKAAITANPSDLPQDERHPYIVFLSGVAMIRSSKVLPDRVIAAVVNKGAPYQAFQIVDARTGTVYEIQK